MTLMTKSMLCPYHSQIHDLTKAKVTGVGPPITHIVSSLSPGLSLAAVPSLAPAALFEGQARALPIVLQLPGGLLIMGTSLDYEN